MCHDFGEYDVNLNLQNLLEDAESEVVRMRDAGTRSAVGVIVNC